MFPGDSERDDSTDLGLPPERAPGSEPLPGCRLIAPLGRGGSGEVWKCVVPGGLLKAIKFVRGGLVLEAPAEAELHALERIKAIRHPFLLSLERIEQVGSELVILLELADGHLADVLAEHQRAGRPGIPRDQLLIYLREAAEALDLLNLRHRLLHLDVKPKNLFLVGNHVKVGDFGLVNSLEGARPGRPLSVRLGAITPTYAAPELFENTISAHSDQYGLAIVYQELLTGSLPFDGKNARQLMLQHGQGQPNLQPLPEADRAIVARALSRRPEQRFACCGDFIRALLREGTGYPTTAAGPVPSSALLAPSEESLDGLRLLGCIRRTPLTEVHRAQSADGSERLVTMLFGHPAREELVAELAALHSPTLAPVKVVRDGKGGLALIGAGPTRSLRDRFGECVSSGLPGIPRPELLAYLRGVATALDFLYQRHGVAHLGLNPRNLLLEGGGRPSIADFGLAQLLWLPAGQAVARLNSRYSAPELFHRQAGSACDQYSLALIYHEMITGALPDQPEVGGAGLEEADRAALARALAPDPAQRWGSCTELIAALEASTPPAPRPEPAPALLGASNSRPDDGQGGFQARWDTNLTRDQVRSRLDGFRQRWKGLTVGADASALVYRLPLPQRFWQRWTGRQSELEVSVHLGGADSGRPATEVRVEVRPNPESREQKGELLEVLAPLVIDSVRAFLQVGPGDRRQERRPWPHSLQVCSLWADGRVAEPIECQGKDLSPDGIGFYLFGDPPAARLSLHLPQTPQTAGTTVLARVVRVQSCGEGWYEVGAVLLRGEEPPAGARP